MRRDVTFLLVSALIVQSVGCQHPCITAVAMKPNPGCPHYLSFLYDPCQEPAGIPFYLPKPLLIISKNFRNIEETKVGLTDGAPIPNYFDDQAKYADLNARTNFAGLNGTEASGAATGHNQTGDPNAPAVEPAKSATAAPATVYSKTGAPVSPGQAPSDGLKPEAFFTYHIVFVPDLTQKYGLKIRGGVGEIRAAMNLVNGWQFTGLGPYYMKDSSTAQNILSSGITANLAASGVADVVKAVASLRPSIGGGGGRVQSEVPPQKFLDPERVRAVDEALRNLRPKFLTIPAYAEISIYEPFLTPEGTMEWKLIAEHKYDRNVVATDVPLTDIVNLMTTASAPGAAAPVGTGVQSEVPGTGPGATPPGQGLPSPLPMPQPVAPPLNEVNGPGQLPPLAPPTPINPGPAAVNPRRVDPALRRTQAPADIDSTAVVRAFGNLAGQPDGAGAAPTLQVAPTDPGRMGFMATRNTAPQLQLSGVPPGTPVQLTRLGRPLGSTTAGPNGVATFTDPGPLAPGEYAYEAFSLADPKGSASLAQLKLHVMPPEIPTTPPPGTGVTQASVGGVAAPAAAVPTTSLDSMVLRQVLGTGGALPLAVAAPATMATLPVPSAGGPVINQFFGKTHLAGAAIPDAAQPRHRWIAWLHHDRPKERTVAVGGLDADAAVAPVPVAAAPVVAPVASAVPVAGTGVR
jgi:hypothetical protein